MKSWVTMIMVLYVVIGVFYSALGAFTHGTFQRLGEQERHDEVYDVIVAGADANGELLLCVAGIYDGQRSNYWLQIDVLRMAQNAGKLLDESGYRRTYGNPEWSVPRGSIADDTCTATPDQLVRQIPVRRVHDIDHYVNFYADSMITQIVQKEPGDEFVILTERMPNTDSLHKKLVYVNKQLAFRSGSDYGYPEGHFVVLEPSLYTTQGSSAWLVVLPFAWAADIVTWPVQLLMWIDYGSAH